jgi:hypothetical protein
MRRKGRNQDPAEETYGIFFGSEGFFLYQLPHGGEALSEFLNSYLEIMTQIVIKWGGTLDKYMGDAIMVFFGDPEFTSDKEHALSCVKMAIEMREKMKDLRKNGMIWVIRNPCISGWESPPDTALWETSAHQRGWITPLSEPL